MLRTRVITALILAALLFAAIFLLPRGGWVAVIAVVAALAGWEFARLAGFGRQAAVVFGVVVGIACVSIALLLPEVLSIHSDSRGRTLARTILGGSALFWLLLAPLWLRFRWPLRQGAPAVLIGFLLLIPTWLAMVQIRDLHPWLLVACMALVSFADIAAYFSGRRFGRRKLAPNISPGKTWEGAIGATVVVTLYGIAVTAGIGWANTPGRLLLLVLVLPTLTFISIEGDLFESLLKRQSGFKDSSNLLPGHGGVLDRIDSLTSTLPLLALLISLT